MQSKVSGRLPTLPCLLWFASPWCHIEGRFTPNRLCRFQLTFSEPSWEPQPRPVREFSPPEGRWRAVGFMTSLSSHASPSVSLAYDGSCQKRKKCRRWVRSLVTGQGQMSLLGKLIWMAPVKYQVRLKIWLGLMILLIRDCRDSDPGQVN